MLGFIIALSIAISIFVITSIVVMIRRHQKRKQNVGQVFQARVIDTSATHTVSGGYPVPQMTTTMYQTQVYAAPYVPQTGVSGQMPMPMTMPGGQPPAPGKMNSLKIICYLSGIFNMMISVYFGYYAYNWYTNPENKNRKFKRDTPYAVWIKMTVFSLVAFIFSILMIIGIVKKKSRLIFPFLITMQLITFIIISEAFVVMFRHLNQEYTADTVATEFFIQIGIAASIIISLVPCFKLYAKYSGRSFFAFVPEYCPCCQCGQKSTTVPNEELKA